MAESMKDFERELEASFKRIDEGDIISGTVVSVDESGVVLDLKFYAEGFIPVEEKRNKISNIQVGFVTEGTVESLQPYGAFVELGNGVSGLVHISQICEKRIRKPSEVLSVGDKVKVKVIAIKDGKLSLSIKEASDLMAKEVEEESFELPESGEEATTSLGALFANIKL